MFRTSIHNPQLNSLPVHVRHAHLPTIVHRGLPCRPALKVPVSRTIQN